MLGSTISFSKSFVDNHVTIHDCLIEGVVVDKILYTNRNFYKNPTAETFYLVLASNKTYIVHPSDIKTILSFPQKEFSVPLQNVSLENIKRYNSLQSVIARENH